nr:TAXI family TRAP transporter solute-binding subunit [Desulfobulbus alkaliphilus]
MVLFILTLLLVGANFGHAEVRPFRIGTGGLGGAYYPVGKLIALGITAPIPREDGREDSIQGIPGLVGVAYNSTGSVANVLAVAANEIEAGLAQADVAFQAIHGQGPFADVFAARNLRAVASLYPEKLQIVTRRDTGIRSVVDFRNNRISIDELGSGTLPVMRIVLEAHGLTENDFFPVYLKPVFTTEKMINREIHGFSMMGGVPMEAVSQIIDTGLFLVPIAPPTAVQIAARYPFLTPGIIPANAYQGLPETPTLQVHALLVVHSNLDHELVYQLTRALWNRRTQELLATGHPVGQSIRLESAMEGLSIPLHPGAEQFYQEQGMVLP